MKSDIYLHSEPVGIVLGPDEKGGVRQQKRPTSALDVIQPSVQAAAADEEAAGPSVQYNNDDEV